MTRGPGGSIGTDIQLARRSCAELIGGGFVLLPVGVLVHLVARNGDSHVYTVAGIVLVVAGWTLLGLGLTRLGTKVDDLYKQGVHRKGAAG